MYYLVIILVGSLQCTRSAKILSFFPMPWRSHQFVYQALVKELAESGHEVDFYTPVPISNAPKNLTQFQVQDRLKEGTDIIDDEEFMNAIQYRAIKMVYDGNSAVSRSMYSQEKVFTDLFSSTKKYDLIISEYFLSSEHMVYLSHKFKAPLVAIVCYPDHPWVNEIAGFPDNPSYMISYQARTNDKMAFTKRLYNFYITLSMIFVCYWETATRQQTLADTYLRYNGWENRPRLTKMISDPNLILINSHISFVYPYPKAPHVKEIGGIHLRDPKPLPENLNAFMDDAPHGVIYFSLGTMVDANEMLKGGKFEIFSKVFASLKQKVLWKVVKRQNDVKSPNIRAEHWFPQQDVLAHNNTILFITHGGLQSMIESIRFGVPTIGMPVFFDQFKDVKFMTTVGMGLQLNYDNITEETVSWTINEVISNPQYRENAIKRRELFMDRPITARQEAVYWIEYVIKHGNVLQPRATKMPLYQIYMLDILATMLAAAILLCYIVKHILKRVLPFHKMIFF